jgi:hypothetical protein
MKIVTAIIVLTVVLIIIPATIGWPYRLGRREKFSQTIPNVVYSVWTGANALTPTRQKIIDNIRSTIGVPHVMVTLENLHMYVLPNHPLHEGYQYLSRMHKADYLRCYLMHHYGGGYTDLKFISHSWEPAFKKIRDDSNIWFVGLGGKNKFNIAGDMDTKVLKDFEKNRLTSVGYFIVKPGTPFTTDWYNGMLRHMDTYLPTLRQHPAVYTREAHNRPPEKWCADETDPEIRKLDCPTEPTKYPIAWIDLIKIVWTLQSRYLTHIAHGIPEPDTSKAYDDFIDPT